MLFLKVVLATAFKCPQKRDVVNFISELATSSVDMEDTRVRRQLYEIFDTFGT